MEIILPFCPNLPAVNLASPRIKGGSTHPVVAVWMEVTQEDEAQHDLIFVLAGTFVAAILGSVARTQLGDPAKELVVLDVGLHLTAQRAIVINDLPVADGVLELGRELLRSRRDEEEQSHKSQIEGAQACALSCLQVRPLCMDYRANRPEESSFCVDGWMVLVKWWSDA
jgi:hypothetical protein